MPDVPDQTQPSGNRHSGTTGPRLPSGLVGVNLPLPHELAAALPEGAYAVEGFLGQGGMGAVYKGVQLSLTRPVAIKIMRRDQGRDHPSQQRFRREALAMAELNHPNIVKVIDFGEAGPDYLYLVMEFVDGTDVADVIRSGRMTQETALRVLPQICDALQFAHDHGIIHRDIKPSNIILTSESDVKLADFGLAKRPDDDSAFRTETGPGMGTPDYAAPEQVSHQFPVDHRADIFALGVTMYQMLTGHLPRGSWRPPSERADVDPLWDGIVIRALQVDPKDRYQSASEIKEAVSRISSAAVVLAERSGAAGGRSERGKGAGYLLKVFSYAAGAALAAMLFIYYQSSHSDSVQHIGGLDGEWRNLIPQAQWHGGSAVGTWTEEGGGLRLKGETPWALCEIPVDSVPNRYDLRIQMTRGVGSGLAFYVAFRGGASGGFVVLDYYNDKRPEFGDGLRRAGVESLYGGTLLTTGLFEGQRERWLPQGERKTLLLKVRESSLVVYLDEELIYKWQGEWSDFKQGYGHAATPLKPYNGRPVFAVGCHRSEAVFHSIEMRQDALLE